jgi:uncharacterized membrane protein
LAAEQLAALGGPADAATQAAYAGDFEASGGLEPDNSDEGAWELRLLSDYAQFTRPGLGDDGGPTGQRQFHQHGMRVLAGPLTITISQEPCSSGSVQLPYTARVLFEGVSYEGCARPGVSDADRPTWASLLPDLMPAVDACLAHVSARPARITFAGAIDDGQISVRVREADGSRRECISDATGHSVSAYDPVSDLDHRTGEGDPEFQRGGAQPAASHCRTVTPAVNGAGEHLGWLIRRSC